MKKIALLLAFVFATQLSAAYHVVRHIPIGGTGGWDYLAVDSAARRLYVSSVLIIPCDTSVDSATASFFAGSV